MRTNQSSLWFRRLLILIMCCALPVVAGPFDPEIEVRPGVTAATVGAHSPTFVEALALVDRASRYDGMGGYPGYTLAHPIIKATVEFSDDTSEDDFESCVRISWFRQILFEHGCSDNIQLSKRTEGKVPKRKTFIDVTGTIEGRGFVIEAIVKHYGGRLLGDPKAVPVSSGDSSILEINSLEQGLVNAELKILDLSFEVDELLVRRWHKQGNHHLSFRWNDVSTEEKALSKLKSRLIPDEKSWITETNEKILWKFQEMAQKAIDAGNFQLAIDLNELSRDKSERAAALLRNARLGLGQ